ncbi:MAG: outer membrane beta-barrel family protein [Flavobacteriaceae bacterium]|jgi:outer membrane receptor protein involved in Fe transport|nr:outer membrane beta-barrel family protein [Flavobacteriaceae bacterium]
MKRLIIALLLFGIPLSTLSQTPSNLKIKKNILEGLVIDKETQEPLEYATISLLNEMFPERIQGGITNTEGKFKLEVFPGKYNITIEYIGFDKITLEGKTIRVNENLGTFELEIAAESLNEIELVGERTEVEIRLDKRIYNVGKDITVRGGSVADVLDNVPSVSVDVEGNIALRGNENVRILINGKPSGLVGLSGPQGLRSLPAESIEKVEVVTSPSARYEASGTAGILNIILKKEELEGFNGSFIVNGGFPTTYGGNATLNWRTKKLNIFSTTSLRSSESRGGGIFESENFDPVRFVNENRDYQRNRNSTFFNLGAEYLFDEKTSLTLSGFLRRSNNESNNTTEIDNLNASGQIIDEFGRYQSEEEIDNSQQFTANFTKKFDEDGHELIIEFQTETSGEDESDLAENTRIFDQESESLEDQRRTLLQMDYVWPINQKTQFELGYRGNFSFQETEYNVFDLLDTGRTPNTQLTNFLGFTQNVNAAYTQFGQKINKFSYLMGLRMEKTHIEIDQRTSNIFKEKDYTDWFPTLNLSFEFNEKENVTLGYSRRIRRPRSWSLNPFRSLTSLTFFRQGNPDLDPSYSNLIDMGYLKRWDKFTFNGSVYYQKATQVIERITEATGELVQVSLDPLVELPEFRFTSVNLSENTRTGTEFTLTYTPKRKVRISGNFNIFNSETVGTYKGMVLDRDIVSWFARVNSSFPLPLGINAQLRGFYFGPRANAQTESKGIVSFSGALNKSMLKDKGTLSFRVSDILNSSRRKSTTVTADFRNYTEFQWRQPTYVFTFTYRINERKNDRRRNGRENYSGGGDEEPEF